VFVECRACGSPVPEGAKFCPECAAPLTLPAESAEQRKTVTALFCDVTGSTALGERLDPETMRRVLARFFDTARTVIEGHGGNEWEHQARWLPEPLSGHRCQQWGRSVRKAVRRDDHELLGVLGAQVQREWHDDTNSAATENHDFGNLSLLRDALTHDGTIETCGFVERQLLAEHNPNPVGTTPRTSYWSRSASRAEALHDCSVLVDHGALTVDLLGLARPRLVWRRNARTDVLLDFPDPIVLTYGVELNRQLGLGIVGSYSDDAQDWKS
jgi:hypothetical protein